MWKKKRRSKIPKGYDSVWEHTIDTTVLSEATYHGPVVNYTKPETKHKYEPDWVLYNTELTIYIEGKGRFRTSEEAKKYIYVRDCLKENEELVFLFQHPHTPMPNAQKRRDGSKRSHAEWATKNKFRWFDENTITELLDEVRDDE